MRHMKYLVALIALAILSCLMFAVIKIKERPHDVPSQPLAELIPGISEKLAARATNKYSPLGTTTGEILSHENDALKDRVLDALVWRLGQKSENRGWTNLSDTERRLIAVYAMEEEVLDGGFKQYFSTSLGGDADVALAGLKDMGATLTGQVMERAMAQFPGGKPPTDDEQRHAVMDKIDATAEPEWRKCDDDYSDALDKDNLDALGLAYAKKKRADIILP